MRLCVGKLNSDLSDSRVHTQLLNYTSWGQRFILCNLNKKWPCHLLQKAYGTFWSSKTKAHFRHWKPILVNGQVFVHSKRWFQSLLGKFTLLATGKQPTSLLSSSYRVSFICEENREKALNLSVKEHRKMKYFTLPECPEGQFNEGKGGGSNKQVAEIYLWHWGGRTVMSTEGNHGWGFQGMETCQYG